MQRVRYDVRPRVRHVAPQRYVLQNVTRLNGFRGTRAHRNFLHRVLANLEVGLPFLMGRTLDRCSRASAKFLATVIWDRSQGSSKVDEFLPFVSNGVGEDVPCVVESFHVNERSNFQSGLRASRSQFTRNVHARDGRFKARVVVAVIARGNARPLTLLLRFRRARVVSFVRCPLIVDDPSRAVNTEEVFRVRSEIRVVEIHRVGLVAWLNFPEVLRQICEVDRDAVRGTVVIRRVNNRLRANFQVRHERVRQDEPRLIRSPVPRPLFVLMFRGVVMCPRAREGKGARKITSRGNVVKEVERDDLRLFRNLSANENLIFVRGLRVFRASV